MTDDTTPISHLPLPEPETLPEDIRKVGPPEGRPHPVPNRFQHVEPRAGIRRGSPRTRPAVP